MKDDPEPDASAPKKRRPSLFLLLAALPFAAPFIALYVHTVWRMIVWGWNF